MAGMQTDPQVMASVAAEAEDIVDRLLRVATTLDGAMSGLGQLDGEIKNAFWQGHHNNLEAMVKLRTKLHGMSIAVVNAKSGYEHHDSNTQQVFGRLANEAAAGGGGTGGGSTGGSVGSAIDTSIL
jgi:hypothetical protein